MAIAELVDRGLARYWSMSLTVIWWRFTSQQPPLCFRPCMRVSGFPLQRLKVATWGDTSAGTAMESLTDGADILVDPLATESIADGLVRSVVSGPEQGLAEPKIRRWRHVAEDTPGVYLKL